MKKLWMTLPALLLALAITPAIAQKGGTPAAKTTTQQPAAPLQMKTVADSVNYALGINMLTTLKQQGVNAEPNFIIAGINDAAKGKPGLTPEQVQLLIAQLQQALAQKRQAEQPNQQGTAQQGTTQQGTAQSTTQPTAPKPGRKKIGSRKYTPNRMVCEKSSRCHSRESGNPYHN